MPHISPNEFFGTCYEMVKGKGHETGTSLKGLWLHLIQTLGINLLYTFFKMGTGFEKV